MTDANSSLRIVKTIEELVQEITVELVGVTFYKVGAELNDDTSSNDPDVGELTPTYGLKLLSEQNEIGVRFSVTLVGDLGRVEVDVAANYETPFPVEIPEEVRLSFANDVGVMALIPYVREAVWGLTQRVFGTAVVMPVFQRGQISFGTGDKGGPEGQ